MTDRKWRPDSIGQASNHVYKTRMTDRQRWPDRIHRLSSLNSDLPFTVYGALLYHLVRLYYYWANVRTVTYRPINHICTIYHACLITDKCPVVLPKWCYIGWWPKCSLSIHYSLMVKSTGIIASKGFVELVCKIAAGVYLPHLHNILSNMIPNKMIAKCHSFTVQGATRISRVQHHTHDFHKYWCRFWYLDTRLSNLVLKHKWLPGSLIQICEIGTECSGLYFVMEF